MNGDQMNDEIVLLDFNKVMRFFIRNIVKSIYICALPVILVLIYLFTIPNSYTSQATILPTGSGNSLSDFSSAASLIGLSIPDFSGDGATKDELIPDIVYSETMLKEIINIKWKYNVYDSLVSLYTIFEVDLDEKELLPERAREEALIKILRTNVINFSKDKRSNITTAYVTIPGDPFLAKEILEKILEKLESYFKNIRKTKSTAEKEFLEVRLQDVYNELVINERKLSEFELKNKSWQSSPELHVEWKNISREVTVSNSLWAELRKQYELIKLNVEKEKITIEVLDAPNIPSKKSGPQRLIILIVFSFILYMTVNMVLFFKMKYNIVVTYFKNALSN